jgi:hypothetical protein
MRRALIPPHGSKFPAQKTNRRKKEGGKNGKFISGYDFNLFLLNF